MVPSSVRFIQGAQHDGSAVPQTGGASRIIRSCARPWAMPLRGSDRHHCISLQVHKDRRREDFDQLLKHLNRNPVRRGPCTPGAILWPVFSVVPRRIGWSGCRGWTSALGGSRAHFMGKTQLVRKRALHVFADSGCSTHPQLTFNESAAPAPP